MPEYRLRYYETCVHLVWYSAPEPEAQPWSIRMKSQLWMSAITCINCGKSALNNIVYTMRDPPTVWYHYES